MKRFPLFLLSVSLLLAAIWLIVNRPVAAAPAASTANTTSNLLEVAAEKDTWVDEENPSTNYGSNSFFVVERDSNGNEGHGLIYFDTSSLPDNINVITATLDLYSVINLNQAASVNVGLLIQPEAVLSSWAENSVSWNNRPPSIYLNDLAVEYQEGWLTFDVTNIAQAWASDSVENHGIKLVPQSGQTGWSFFLDRSTGTTGPQLTISYELAPPPCEPISSVIINGPSQGQTATLYSFNATISPVDATTPFTYTWTSPGQPTFTTETAEYSWDSAGQKTINLTVENCAGSVFDTHTVTIEEPAPACETPLTGLTLTGPTQGVTGDNLTFNTVVSPLEATPPITFTWEATGHPPHTTSGDSPDDSHTYSWTTSGSKEVIVTAENCGASFVEHHALEVLSPSQLPDLVVSSAWYDGVDENIGYILGNIGGSIAAAGHETELYRDGDLLATETFSQEIPAGGLRAGVFNNNWSCSGTVGMLGLLTDAADIIAEGSETNNELTASWPCDLTIPTIIAGPTPTNISETTAQISWTTDELTNGRLEYGPGSYSTTSIDAGSGSTGHTVDLTGLQPGTTYRIRVFAGDEAGNEVNSDWVYFETELLGTDPPQITGIEVDKSPGSPYETYVIQVMVADATYVERVEFYLDGTLIGTQYSAFQDTFFQSFAPYVLGYTRDTFYDVAGLPLEVVAYSTGGAGSSLSRNEIFTDPGAPIRLTIWVPGDGRTIIFDGAAVPDGTTQLVQVWAAQYDWECTSGGYAYGNLPGLACTDANPRPASDLRLYFNYSVVHSAQPANTAHNFTLDLSGYTAGTKVLQLFAYAEDGSSRQIRQDLILEQGTPQLRMERTVSRQDNLFTIDLTIHNDGDGSAQIYKIEDLLQGFVAINRDTRPGLALNATGYYMISSKFDNWINSNEPAVTIDLVGGGEDYLTLPPGDSFTIEYEAIPVIYPSPNSQDHHIGVDENNNRSQIEYTYAGSGQMIEVPFVAPGNSVHDPALGGNVPLDQAVVAAFASADYLLATSPYRLSIKTTNSDQVPNLLSDMARLARVADGVIAVTGIAPPFHVIDNLLEPGGYWYESLHPNFRQVMGGYVLFVGEDDVIPTQDAGWGVSYSDLRYASTGGAARPELILGRIIGNDVVDLRRPIQAAANFHQYGSYFDNSHALMWSGRGDGEGTFWDDVKAMDGRLNDTAQVTRFRGKDYDSGAELLPVLQQNSGGQDWIIYRGHGGRTIFGDNADNAIFSWDVATLDLSSRPVVMALACTTGDYAGGSDGIAEAFLKEGAAVFIGSVDISARSRNSDAARAFFNRWHSGRSVGWVLTDLMRDKWGNSTWWWSQDSAWERWIYDYQLFGDPKYGEGVTGAAQASTQMETGARLPQEDGFTSSLEVVLPELEISTGEEGWHYVSLPDGDRMTKEGEYAVPVHTLNVHYPAGERVQDVTLDLRSGLEVTTGLMIPLTFFQLDEAGQSGLRLAGPQSRLNDDATSWYPQQEQPFRWQVFENADGSSDLQIIIYPFMYNPVTTDGRFYRQWLFNVHTIETNVTLKRLDMPAVAGPGDSLTLALDLYNSGQAEDVVISAAIYSLRGEPLAGLPLRTLHELQGNAGIELTWDTMDVALGDYVVNVTLTNVSGHILDSASTIVTLMDEQVIYLPLVQRP